MSYARFLFSIERPSFGNFISSTPKRIHKSRPPEGGLVGIHDDQDAARFRDAMGFSQGLKQGVLVIVPRLLLSPLAISCGDAFLFLRRQLAGEMLGVEKADGRP